MSSTDIDIKKDSGVADLEQYDSDTTSIRNEPELLKRKLNARQINMITIAGVIGTGLFLGISGSLKKGGPGALIISYAIIGILVYLTMLALGEMSTQFPVSGSFTTFAKRFGSESFGFAIISNYWLNDAVSVASDLVALQVIFEYWNPAIPGYAISLIFWVFLLFLNVFDVRFYGETEYWLSLLKVITIIIFFIISIVVNAGANINHEYIGFKYWSYGEAPFVNGFKGFASIFVSTAFAYGGLESIALVAGETKRPSKTIPRVIKTVFWRILIFYILTAFFIGMNVPYNYPGLSSKTVKTSPFTIVFQLAGAKAGGSYMNAVIVTSVISAGNHALYAGSRLAYNMGTQGYLPSFLTRLNRWHTPYIAVIITWLCGGISFGASFIGAGQVWDWLQAIVGLSNLISWWVIGITSIRFRRGMELQGKTHQLIFKNWTYPYGPWIVVIFGGFIILVQGWSTFAPWDRIAFVQSYLELAIFPSCFIFWWLWKRGKDRFVRMEDMDFETDRYIDTEEDIAEDLHSSQLKGWAKFKYNFAANFL